MRGEPQLPLLARHGRAVRDYGHRNHRGMGRLAMKRRRDDVMRPGIGALVVAALAGFAAAAMVALAVYAIACWVMA
jgi:hypothetical protein